MITTPLKKIVVGLGVALLIAGCSDDTTITQPDGGGGNKDGSGKKDGKMFIDAKVPPSDAAASDGKGPGEEGGVDMNPTDSTIVEDGSVGDGPVSDVAHDLFMPDTSVLDTTVPPDTTPADISDMSIIADLPPVPDLLPPDAPVPTCSDGAKNGNETDVDCGGPDCPTCLGGKICTDHSDCEGKACLGSVCAYAPSCAQLYTLYGQKADGLYVIDPTGGDFSDRFTVVCDMTTDGGGWTLVGKGREGWLWDDNGQGTAAEVLNHTTNTVAYLPSVTVRAIAGNIPWDNWAHGLRIIRGSGVDDRWFVTPKTADSYDFNWSVLNDNRHSGSVNPCNTIPINATSAHWKQIGRSNVIGAASLVDNISLTGNDCDRVFTPAWASHDCTMGFATGAGCKPSNDCWSFSTETACIPHSTVWVKNCPLCPEIYYDVANPVSYPGSGTTWYDISGNTPVNASITPGVLASDCPTLESYNNVQSFLFKGKECSKAQFDNTNLNPQAFTAIYWVYSLNPFTDTNQGGLYVNRDDTTPNATDWIWFGKWQANKWYFRVNNGACCQDLPGSGSTDFPTYFPLGTWEMVHFGFQSGKTNGWKWGVNGNHPYVGTLPARPYTQSESISTIGYGPTASGSYWYGGIASVRFYNRLLSDTEIQAEFNRLKGSYGL